jgi:hypothetical protein
VTEDDSIECDIPKIQVVSVTFNPPQHSSVDAFLEGVAVGRDASISFSSPFAPGDPQDGVERNALVFLSANKRESLHLSLLEGARGEPQFDLGEEIVERIGKGSDGLMIRWVSPAEDARATEEGVDETSRGARRRG